MQLIGQILQETYRIDRLLGRGGKGEVYLASHLRLPRRFAVKVLFPHNAYKREEVLRFRREAEVVSALGHPNIIEVIDFNHTSWGAPYIVMEYLEGEDLSARLQRVGRLPLETVATMLRSACSALQAAHQQGVIHRDLKPSNIFLCRKGDQEDWVKVVDFGLSKVWGATVAVTNGKLAIGTPRYMAPEQAVGRSSEADARTDIFSMGGILFRMLTGQLPFMGDSIQALLNNIVFVDPPEVTEIVPELPQAVAQVVDRALRKRPEDRHQSMEELWQAFAEASGVGVASSASQSTAAATVEPPTPGPAPSPTDDPHPEHSATFTHALGEMVEAESVTDDARTRIARRHHHQRPRRGRAAGIVVVSTALVVAGVGVWLGLHLVRTAPPSRHPAAAAGFAADLGAVAGPLDASSVAADAGTVQRVRLRTRPDAGIRRRRRPHRRRHHAKRPARRPAKRAGPAAQRAGAGTIKVVTRNGGALLWAWVFIDGTKVGHSPVHRELPTGEHVVVVHRPGFRSITRRVRVKSGQTAKVVLDLEPK